MKHLTGDTRVLVADGAQALVLRNDGDGAFPNLRLERSYGQDNPATREQGSDKPGRTNDSLGRRSAMENTDWHKVAEDRFVQGIADDMAKDLQGGGIQQIYSCCSGHRAGRVPQGFIERPDGGHDHGDRQGPDQPSHRQDRENRGQGAGRREGVRGTKFLPANVYSFSVESLPDPHPNPSPQGGRGSLGFTFQ